MINQTIAILWENHSLKQKQTLVILMVSRAECLKNCQIHSEIVFSKWRQIWPPLFPLHPSLSQSFCDHKWKFGISVLVEHNNVNIHSQRSRSTRSERRKWEWKSKSVKSKQMWKRRSENILKCTLVCSVVHNISLAMSYSNMSL